MEVDFEKTVFFNFQKPSKIKGFRLRTRETANRILSLARLPIPSHRRLFSGEYFNIYAGQKQVFFCFYMDHFEKICSGNKKIARVFA